MFKSKDPIKVLLVDDDPSVLTLLGSYLRRRGFIVYEARNGVEAMALVREREPPLVITDWLMPEMDGIELCRRIRSADATNFTYVLFLTANREPDLIVTAFEAGADDYITKPFDRRELLARIEAAERIIRLSAFYAEHMVKLHSINAEFAVVNGRLQRLMSQLQQDKEDARQAEAHAEQANKARGHFLATVSHEIRSIMTAIIGFTEILRAEADTENSPPERKEAIDTILRNGQLLMEIINDMLDLSKIDAGKFDVERIRCSPIQVLEDVRSLLSVRAIAKGLDLKVIHEGALPETIESDPTRLRQILINLVGNAIKFTETGSVRVVARLVRGGAAGPLLEFEVTDTGIGMSREQIAKLFQPFGQAEVSTARRFGGSGLGLVISKRFAEMLNGDICVESAPGQGTTFRLHIAAGPLEDVKMVLHQEPPVRARSETVRPDVESPTTIFGRVLLAEDGMDNQRLIEFILTKAGAEVTVAENGQVALEAVAAAEAAGTPFNLILMDMQMPVMDGYEATRRLRDRGYEGRIIALTAHAMAADREKCLAAGCDEFVTKPVQRSNLLLSVAAALRTAALTAKPTSKTKMGAQPRRDGPSSDKADVGTVGASHTAAMTAIAGSQSRSR